MDGMLQDIRYSARSLRAAPGLVAVAVLMIAVGIGATTAIYSVVRAVLLQPLPYSEPDRLVFVRGELSSRGVFNWPISPRILLDMRERVQTIDELGGVFSFDAVLMNEQGEPVQIRAAGVTPNLFALIGVHPALGRGFNDADAAPLPDGGPPNTAPPTTVILSHRVWQRDFGGDPAVVGRFVELFGGDSEVVGVMDPGFELLMSPDSRAGSDADVWYAPRVDLVNADRRSATFELVGRLQEGATVAQAQSEMEAVVAFLHETNEALRGAGYGIRVVAMHQDVTAQVRPVVLSLLGAVGFVLLIACANVSSLLLVRASGRAGDAAIRAALGASRLRLVRQLLAESLLLAAAGATGGLVLARVGIGWLMALGPPEFPRMESVTVDSGVLGFAVLASVAAALLSGTAPALQVARAGVAGVLQQTGRSAALGRRGVVGNGIIVVEVALAVVLLIGAGLMIRSFEHLQRADPGFRTESALTFELQLQGDRYGQDARAAFAAGLRERLLTLPGVEAVSAATTLPLLGDGAIGRYGTREALEDDSLYGQADYRYVHPGYFDAMGTTVLVGRDFDGSDFAGAGTATVVIDEPIAARLWPAGNAVGQTLVVRFGPEPALMQVIGVVGHQRSRSPAFDSQETVFFNARYVEDPRTTQWVVRTSGEPTSLGPQVRAEIAQLDPLLLVSKLRTYGDIVRDVMAPTRFALVLIGVFAAVALALAVLGVYSVLAYAVRQRTAEFGLRMVFGAEAGSILRLVLRQGMVPTVAGVVLGLTVAAWMTRYMASLLIQVGPTDPVTYGLAGLLFAAVAALASLVPARRATRVDPVRSLRGE